DRAPRPCCRRVRRPRSISASSPIRHPSRCCASFVLTSTKRVFPTCGSRSSAEARRGAPIPIIRSCVSSPRPPGRPTARRRNSAPPPPRFSMSLWQHHHLTLLAERTRPHAVEIHSRCRCVAAPATAVPLDCPASRLVTPVGEAAHQPSLQIEHLQPHLFGPR